MVFNIRHLSPYIQYYCLVCGKRGLFNLRSRVSYLTYNIQLLFKDLTNNPFLTNHILDMSRLSAINYNTLYKVTPLLNGIL